jgi:hypothetical protein
MVVTRTAPEARGDLQQFETGGAGFAAGSLKLALISDPRCAKQGQRPARNHFLDRNLTPRSAGDGNVACKRPTTHRIERLGVERLARGASTAFASS